MEYFASTWQDYHPILVGAGCLALGYMYGRHCKSMVENHHIHNVPMELDATCNCVASPIVVKPERVTTIPEIANSPSDSALNYSNNSIGLTLERIGKRTISQLDLFQMPKKNKDMLWAQSSAFKKQKGVPVIIIEKKEPIIQSKAKPIYDSDDEILARRLEYFTNQSTSINKPSGSNHVLKLGKKKKKIKSSIVMTTMSSKGKGLVITDSQKSLSKLSTRSRSGLCDLANPQSECSLEDTCKSPKATMCLENCIQVEETNFAHIVAMNKPMALPCAQASKMEYVMSNPMEEHIRDERLVGLMDSQCELDEAPNNVDDTIDEHDEEERLENVRREDGIACKEDDTTTIDNLEEKVPTSQPTIFHVQDRCPMDVEQEVEKEHKAIMDKVLKVSFQEILSVLEEKLKVVLQEDKAHIVSLVREVINISKLLEEEKALEGFTM